MKIRHILLIVGIITLFLSLAMVFPLFVSLLFGDGDTRAFLYAFMITSAVGVFLTLACRGSTAIEISHREGFVVVALSWMGAAFFSALPFIFSGSFPSFVDAVFEAVSGITTTGASVLTDVDHLPHGLLFWRSMIHWLGGMGIVVLSLAILPLLGIGGMQLYKAEASTVSADKFAPRIKEMARILFAVYLIISFTQVVFLSLAGMDLFDAFIHTFGTVATGGFSSRNTSVGYFQSALIEGIIIVFMFLGATNFSLHYRFFHEGYKVYLKNEEFRFYLLVMTVATILVTSNLIVSAYYGVGESLRYAIFQVVSIMTTTGYSTTDFEKWPFFSQMVLLVVMFFGGSTGSTTGSIKCIRLLILIKLAYREIYRLVHPHAVTPIKLGGKVLSPDIINGVMGYTFLFMGIFALSTVSLTLVGIDLITAISSSIATLGNIGPGLGITGPASNYSTIPDPGKWILILNMLLGRLEIYTILILLLPAFWRG